MLNANNTDLAALIFWRQINKSEFGFVDKAQYFNAVLVKTKLYNIFDVYFV